MLTAKKYIQEINAHFKPLLRRETKALPHHCCLYLHKQKLTIIHTHKSEKNYEIKLIETIPVVGITDIPLLLKGYVKKHALEKIPTTLLLSPEDYQLYLIESLLVEKGEMQEALSWRLKTLISFPIEEAVFDWFTIPAKKSTPNYPIIAGVVTQKKPLTDLTLAINECNFNLISITIPELALRNLSAEFEEDEKSTAFVYLFSNMAILNITRQKNIYFTRRFYLNKNEKDIIDYQQLCLEILRYFDYFQAQWRYPTPSRVFIGGESIDLEASMKNIAEHMSLPAKLYHLKNFTSEDEKLKNKIEKYLLPLGCLLEEKEHVPATN